MQYAVGLFTSEASLICAVNLQITHKLNTGKTFYWLISCSLIKILSTTHKSYELKRLQSKMSVYERQTKQHSLVTTIKKKKQPEHR